ncbi:MAG: chromosomal replication initiator protein DnaA [Deltaproteobacteria bacterium]|nr:chromosomal replication initiator protein DnaA [Deltaproteobacteria bacterium]
MNDLWKAVLTDLQKSLPPQTFSTWILPLRPVARTADTLTVEVPNKFFVDWLQDQGLTATIEASLSSAASGPLSVGFQVEKSPKAHMRDASAPERPDKADRTQDLAEKARKIGLNAKYTFDSFVVGSSNQFAHAASLAVAEKSPRTYNPLFIYGGVGLGKTHLLNAIGNHKIFTYPNAKVCYIHSENFMNELIQALASKKMPEFRDKYRRMDILLIDDIQFIAGKERTQEEFFHTFNTLYESHRNIVVTSDKFPKEIPGLEDRLRSRFEWGLIADIQAPDLETKVAILQKKAEIEAIPLPYEVSVFLASNFSSNIRELEGSLVRIAAFASLTHTEITIELAKEVLRDFIKDSSREFSIDSILKIVAEYYHVNLGDLKGKRRTKAIAYPRQVAMFLCRETTACSFPEIGQKIGGRDHSTIMYACTKIAEALKGDRSLQDEVQALRSLLNR